MAAPVICLSALATEAVAAARGLDLAVQHGYKNGILESDSLALIDGLKGREESGFDNFAYYQ